MASRRCFLKSSVACSSLISLSGAVPSFLLRASASTVGRSQETVLVVIQLAGGNDGLNTVIPYGDDEYYKNRFTLAVPRSRVARVDDQVGLHPAMADLSRLLDQGQLNVVQGVGYPNPNRSHFESMDLWHTAHRQSDSVPVGWLGRYMDRAVGNSSLPAIHLGGEDQPLALAAESTIVPSIRSANRFRLKALNDRAINSRLATLVKTPRAPDNHLLGFIHDTENVALMASQKLESIARAGRVPVDYPSTGLANKLKTVANLIGSGLPARIYYVVLDGFDTHANQAAAHQGLLAELSGAISAFTRHLEEQGDIDRVAVMTFSEFGRRVRENASRGTDHGTAAPMFLAGGGVRGGITGEHPSLHELDNGDLVFKIDYRQVYASVLEQWLGTDSRPVLGGAFEPLELFDHARGPDG